MLKMGGMLPPGFAIGKFILRDGIGGRDKIYIETSEGEGGDFSVDRLEELIDRYYHENF